MERGYLRAERGYLGKELAVGLVGEDGEISPRVLLGASSRFELADGIGIWVIVGVGSNGNRCLVEIDMGE